MSELKEFGSKLKLATNSKLYATHYRKIGSPELTHNPPAVARTKEENFVTKRINTLSHVRFLAIASGIAPSADTNGGGQTVVCKIALHKKDVKLRNETLPLHKKNVKLHIFFVTRPPLARSPLVSAEGSIALNPGAVL